MATGSVRNSKRFRELAAVLKERLQGHDISLVGGEAEELLGAHVSAVAAQLRVTERTVLATYMSEDAVTALAERFAEQKAEYHEATEAAEPVMLDVRERGTWSRRWAWRSSWRSRTRKRPGPRRSR